jgi:excisionase family DNA binding protein
MSKRLAKSLALTPELIAQLADVFTALREAEAKPMREPKLQPIEPLVLRPGEAAKVLRVSPRTIWLMINDGRLPAVRPSPGITFIPMAAIRKLAGG